jgi:plastocyanin
LSNPPSFLNDLLTAHRHLDEEMTLAPSLTAPIDSSTKEVRIQFAKLNERRLRVVIYTLALACLLGCFTASASLAQPKYIVSQKERQFHPDELTLKRGETIEIVNDDGDLRHHAYIKSNTFNFDSGDQEPGSKTDITFPVAGDFNILCAIHPKMKLVVHVK